MKEIIFSDKKNIKILIQQGFILILLIIFSVTPIILKTYTEKEGLYNVLFFFILCKLLTSCIIIFLISIIFKNIDEKLKKTQYIFKFIIVIIYLALVPFIFLNKYIPEGCNSNLGLNFIIVKNIISDIITDETYDIDVEHYCFFESKLRYRRTYMKFEYIKFDNSTYIPITIKDKMVLNTLLIGNSKNKITLYKKSGLIKSINGRNINISMDEYLRLQQDIKKEKIHQILKNQIEQKGENLFQISVKSDGKIHRTELEYENELELYWILKKDGKIIQKIKADTPTCTFQNKGDTTSKYTMFIMGIFDGIEYNLSKEIPVFEFNVEN